MLYISYHGIVVKSAKTRRYDCGIYITSAKFTISGKAAAVYAEPKELSGFPYNGPAIMPVVTFASEEAEAAILQAASCWSAEHPLSAEGRADKLSPAMKMLSDLAWTKVLYDNAEKDYKAYRRDRSIPSVRENRERWKQQRNSYLSLRTGHNTGRGAHPLERRAGVDRNV